MKTKMKAIVATAVATIGTWFAANAGTETINGVTWRYTLEDGKAILGDVSTASRAVPKTTAGYLSVPSSLGGCPVTEIGDDAFSGCINLTGVSIPDSVTRIGVYAFHECSSLRTVTFGSGLKTIDMLAFCFCSDLKGVFEVPEGVTEVAFGAFMGTGVETLVFPSTLQELGAQQMVFGTPVEKVYFKGNAPKLEEDGTVAYPGETSPYCGALQSLVTFVRVGTTGWNDDTAVLPETWPTYEARQIQHYSGETPRGTSGRSACDLEGIALADPTFGKAQTVFGALVASEGGEIVGVVQVKIGKQNRAGKIRISGTATLASGKRVMAKAISLNPTLGEVSGTFAFKSPVGGMQLTLSDGAFTLAGGVYTMVAGKIGGELAGGMATFSAAIDKLPDFGDGWDVIEDALPDREAGEVIGGRKFNFGNAASLRFVMDRESGEYVLAGMNDPAKPNLSALKITYNVKTGVFKGSFKIYAVNRTGARPKLKKFMVTLGGVVVDGKGSGQATLKRPAAGPWPVTIE